MASYVPTTARERQEMMETIGIKDVSELFKAIPEEMLIPDDALSAGLSEMEVARTVREKADKNRVFSSIFRGAGSYNRYIPSIVKQITSKEEFVTTYTPYQAEVSQGVLQSIFEYQTMISELTGLDVSNASVYDGATAAAEAITCCVERKRTKVIVSAAMNPETIKVMKTYCFGADREIALIPAKDGKTDLEALKALLDEETCGVFIQQPNFYGIIEDVEAAGEIAHEAGAKLVVSMDPIAATVLKSPGECGADIAVGEGQSLGLPMSFGGPYLGFMAATEKLMRRLPGRIVGETVDGEGRRGFVLTLQAREQHIRREKATSNICSNEALCAMTAAVYMAAMGEKGMRKAAESSYSKAHYLAEKMAEIPGFKPVFNQPFFNEFVTRCPDASSLMKRLEVAGILGGLPIHISESEGEKGSAGTNALLWCVTEMNTKEEMDTLLAILAEFGDKKGKEVAE